LALRGHGRCLPDDGAIVAAAAMAVFFKTLGQSAQALAA
jgi:hypothetical protein